MKRSVLLLFCASALVFAPCLMAISNEGGAYGSAIENEQDENWCKRNPEECQYRKEREQEQEIQHQQRQEREAYCERYPERCGNIIDQRERSKYCQRYPWKCND